MVFLFVSRKREYIGGSIDLLAGGFLITPVKPSTKAKLTILLKSEKLYLPKIGPDFVGLELIRRVIMKKKVC